MSSTANPGYLLHHLSTALDRQSDLLLQERLDIGFSQFKILMALKWHQGVQQRQIAEYLGQTEASVSRQIKLLHEAGLLTSKVSPTSKRERVTSLTEKGNKRADLAKDLLNQHFDALFGRLSPEQHDQYLQILNRMHEYACRDNLHCKFNQS
ncbi:MAG: MarR family transcriptional regulator [Candidatus Saccharibacteria bacterium]|nr:MarR family transcriptional regulator [Candidatus Saccharibacteria bacterium]